MALEAAREGEREARGVVGEQTGIAWCDHTFNPWWGCVRVSDGCTNCYADTWAHRLGMDLWGPKAERRFFGDKHWADPVKWNRAAAEAGERRRVFCASMADVFEDRRDLDIRRTRLWFLIEETPWLDWLLLTKRPENMANDAHLVPHSWRGGWPANAWAGTTTEHQAAAAARVPELLKVPARIRFLSVEPMLGPVDLTPWLWGRAVPCRQCPSDADCVCGYRTREQNGCPSISWAIYGGESGHGARACNLEWIRGGLEQCRAAGVVPFVKQLGAFPFDGAPVSTDYGRHVPGMLRLAHRAGSDPAEWPEDLRVREFP